MSPRKVAYLVLRRVLRGKGRGGPLLYQYDELFSKLSNKDRDLAEKIIKGICEKNQLLETLIKEISKTNYSHLGFSLKIFLKIGLFQIFFLTKVPAYAAINETVSLTKEEMSQKAAGYANWFLREALRRKDGLISLLEGMGYGQSSVDGPPKLIDYIKKELKDLDIFDIIGMEQQQGHVALRVNSLKITKQDLISKLKAMGVESKPGIWSPEAVIIRKSQIKQIKEEILDSGLAQVQSEASQLAALLLNPMPGETVLDLCSGFGSKAFHMAQLMKNRGLVVSVDKELKRLNELMKVRRALGTEIVKPICADVMEGMNKVFKRPFDKILLDAPCSNLGVIWRRHGLLNRLSKNKMEELSDLQLALLRKAKMVLNPGGYLLYVTCTLSTMENESNIERFLKLEKDMELADPLTLNPKVPSMLLTNSGFLKTIPAFHGTDGFFFALLMRKERSPLC